jgi:uncharacterized metal-binding protein
MTNQLALWLDRDGASEMSCIAGVGGGVTSLVRTARSGQRILALDGCALSCVSASLAKAGVHPNAHIRLSDLGVKKCKHADFSLPQAQAIYRWQIVPAALALAALEKAVRDQELPDAP